MDLRYIKYGQILISSSFECIGWPHWWMEYQVIGKVTNWVVLNLIADRWHQKWFWLANSLI